MKTLLPGVAACLLALFPAGAMANGLLYDLPEDGTWASYELTASIKLVGRDMTITGTIRVASVGKTVEAGKPCRWLEVKMDGKGPGEGNLKMIAKVLVPEEQLGKGKTPLKHAVRAYQKQDNRDAEKLNDPSDINKGALPLVLAGPLEEPEKLAPEVVSSKLGELPCPGEQGTLSLASSGAEQFHITMTNRLNSKAPFGVVTSTWDMQGEEGWAIRMHWDLKFADTGKGAKTELPDAK